MLFRVPSSTPTLDAALRDLGARDPAARIRACEALASSEALADEPSGSADDASGMSKVELHGSRPTRVKRAASRREEALRGLRSLVSDPRPAVRGAAIRALGELQDLDGWDLVVACLDDEHRDVRQLALVAAALIDETRAVELAAGLLNDPRAELRFQATAIVAELGRDEGAVRALLSDADAEVRAHAALALGEIVEQRGHLELDSRRSLSLALGDASEGVRVEAAFVLARVGDTRAVPQLIAALQNAEHSFRAAELLGDLGSPEAVAPLAAIIRSVLKPAWTRAAAARSLAKLGDPRGVPALRRWLAGYRSEIRNYVVAVIGELELTDLASDLANLVDRTRGVTAHTLAEALVRLSGVDATAASALSRALDRRDELARAISEKQRALSSTR